MTAVEIYDERELCQETLTREPDAEALAIIEQLGLKLQVTKDGARLAYPRPTAEQTIVIDALFPSVSKLVNYDAGGIPLRVLKEIRSYGAENPNHILVVRHSPPSEVRDPILLAYAGEHSWMADNTTSGLRDFRLIARWGDALDSWQTLLERAQGVLAKRAIEALEGIEARAAAIRARVLKTGNFPSVRMPQLDNIPDGF